MAKPLKTILKKVEPYNKDYASAGDKHFMAKHEVEVTDDANGNDDTMFKADNVDTYERNVHHHGYDHEKSKAVYETYDSEAARQKIRELRTRKKQYVASDGVKEETDLNEMTPSAAAFLTMHPKGLFPARRHYATVYMQHAKTATDPEAEAKAYKAVGKKFGPQMLNNLKQFHQYNGKASKLGYDHNLPEETELEEGDVVSFDPSKKKPSTLNIGARSATVQAMPSEKEQADNKKKKFLKALGINPDDETFKAAEARLQKLKDGDK